MKQKKSMNKELKQLFRTMQEDVAMSSHLSDSYLPMLEKIFCKPQTNIQLPTNTEARRCVIIVIEEHIGVLVDIHYEADGREYATVLPYKTK